jgi:ribonuclease HI
MDLKSYFNLVNASLMNCIDKSTARIQIYSDGGARKEENVSSIGFAIILYQPDGQHFVRVPLIAGARFSPEFTTAFQTEMLALQHALSIFTQLFKIC